MTKVIHIIGAQGSGKSNLAQDLKEALDIRRMTSKNLTREGIHKPGKDIDLNLVRELCEHDVVFLEHSKKPLKKHLHRGDVVIQIEVAA